MNSIKITGRDAVIAATSLALGAGATLGLQEAFRSASLIGPSASPLSASTFPDTSEYYSDPSDRMALFIGMHSDELHDENLPPERREELFRDMVEFSFLTSREPSEPLLKEDVGPGGEQPAPPDLQAIGDGDKLK